MKKYRLLIYIVSCFIIGFIFTYLVYIGLWSRLIAGFSSVPVWLYILLLPAAFYITLTLHELGHLIAFVVQGVKIRALYLTVFVFYKDKKGWHFTIKPKLWVLFGGMVVPDLPPVHDDAEMAKQTNIFARSLTTAPIVTISFMVLTILSFLLTWIFGSQDLWFGILTILMIYTVLLSSVYIYTFKLNTKHLYGDFVAYRKIKEDQLFQFAEIYQYESFSLNDDEDQTYLYQKARSLIESQTKIEHHMFMIVTLMAYIDSVIHYYQPISPVIDQLLSKITINRFVKTEEGLTLIYQMAEYYYFQKHVEKSYQLIERAHTHAGNKLPKEMKEYLYKRTSHVTHMTYNDAFLANNDNIYIGQGWLLEAIMDPYETARKEHELLPFVVYECQMPEPVEEKKPSDS